MDVPKLEYVGSPLRQQAATGRRPSVSEDGGECKSGFWGGDNFCVCSPDQGRAWFEGRCRWQRPPPIGSGRGTHREDVGGVRLHIEDCSFALHDQQVVRVDGRVVLEDGDENLVLMALAVGVEVELAAPVVVDETVALVGGLAADVER